MLTLQETLAQQSNLKSLCADRPLRTREAFRPNAYYGHSRILKLYAGLSQVHSLKAIVPHGIVLDESFVWRAEARAPMPAVFCWPSYRERAYAALGDKRVVLSAAPFLYLVELMADQPRPRRQGTIFFPHHSTHHVTAEMDLECLAEQLLNLESEYQPVTVCIYWRDYNLGHHAAFEKRGLQIVSAGHMFDPDFLVRLYHLCSLHRYSSANNLGSSMFYSVKAGCSHFYLGGNAHDSVADEQILERDRSIIPSRTESTLRALFGSRQPSATAEQLSAVDHYLGAEYLRSPAELRTQLLQAERLDRWGIAFQTAHGRLRITAPAFLRRGTRKLGRRLLDAARRLDASQQGGGQQP